MASEVEIERVRKDKGLWLPIAQRLFKHVEEDTLPERHVGLIEGLVDRPWQQELSYLQGEWLLDIRDEVELVSSYNTYSVGLLARACYENRFGLDSDDEHTWVTELYNSSRTSIRRYEARRLYVLSKRLGLVEED